MLLLRSIVFLLVLLFHCAVFSQVSQTQHITADEIFFDFVDQHTEDIDAVMGPTWLDEIFEHTELWTADDAIAFLNSMKASIFPISHILIILKNTQSLQRIQQQLNDFQFHTGSDVFIEYVRNYFRESLQQSQPSLEEEALEEAIEDLMLSQMPSLRNKPPWEERIHKDARNWNAIDAILFLDDLENEWDMDAGTIIKGLNATTFFKLAHYISFTLRLEVYTEYFGKNHVKNILHRTFKPFETSDAENIRAMLDTVMTYFDFEKDLMIEILSNNLQLISNTSLDLFNRRTSWLEDFLGGGDRIRGKEEIKRIVRKKKSLNVIRSINIRLNRRTGEYENETEFRVNFLRSRGGYDQGEIIDLFKKNPQAFSTGGLSTDKIAYLEKLLGVEGTDGRMRDGKAELDWVIQNKSFQGVVNFKIYKNKDGQWENEYVKFLKYRGLNPVQIADLFKNDPEVFSKGDLSTDKISYLEELLTVTGTDGKMRDGKTELDWMIQNKSFQGIVSFRIYKNKDGQWENEYVKFLRDRGFTPAQIAEVFKSNSRAFSAGDLSPEKISYLEELLEIERKDGKVDGKIELNWVIQNKSFIGVLNFKVYKNKEGLWENKYVKFLRDRGFTPVQIADLFKNNPNVFSIGNLSLEKIAYLEKLLEVNGRDGKIELNWMIQNKSLQGIVSFKVYKNRKGLWENKYVEFLRDRGLTPVQIAEVFKKSPETFSRGDISNEKITYLEQLLTVTDSNGNIRDGKAELDWVIQNRSFAGIVNFKIHKNKEGHFENEYVEFLRDRGLTSVQIAGLFKANPQPFSMGDLSADKITYLEDLLGVDGKKELNWMIKNKSFAGIVNFKIHKNKEGHFENEYVEFLRDRGFTPVQIAGLFKKSPETFSRGNLSDHKITYLEQLLTVAGTDGKLRDGKAELDWVIQNKSFEGIVDFKIHKGKEGQITNEYVKFLKDKGFTPLQIADLFKKSPETFSRGDLSPHKISYLEGLLEINRRDGKIELNWVIRNKSFQGIVNFKIYKNKDEQWENEHVKFLRDRGFTRLQTADLFKSDPQAFSMGDLSTDKIAYLEKYLGKDDRNKGKKKLDQIILKRGSFKALVLFKYNSNVQVTNRVIDFLENNLYLNQDQVIRIIENHFSEFFIEEVNRRNIKGIYRKANEKDS